MTDPKPWFPVETERLRLRDFRWSDEADVNAYASRPDVSRFMDWGPNTEDETKAFLNRHIEAQARWPRTDVGLAMALKSDDRVIGSIRLWVVDEENPTAEIGYSLNGAYWRQGLTSEAARALIRVGFETLGLHRIVATCDVRNRGSWGVMRKLGMRREGRFQQNRMIKGAWRDTYAYGLLADEWRAAQT